MNDRNRIDGIIKKLRANYGIPQKTENTNILDMLIATKLSQNTTDVSSYKAFTRLKEKFGSWDKVRKADLNRIKDCIKVCGLSNTKAAEIKEMLNKMNKKYGSLDLSFLRKYNDEKIYTELLEYKGIGVKTISCMMNYSLSRDVFPVDTHIHRILNRLGIVRTKNAVNTYKEAREKIPKGKRHEFHVNLIKFGRNICKSINPICGECFLFGDCKYDGKYLYRGKHTDKPSAAKNFIILENI
ncbi:MAG: Endonuclease III [Ignavibacteria bacterium]|nr:Endonuclease III [Ignavibacteria bacterium]